MKNKEELNVFLHHILEVGRQFKDAVKDKGTYNEIHFVDGDLVLCYQGEAGDVSTLEVPLYLIFLSQQDLHKEIEEIRSIYQEQERAEEERQRQLVRQQRMIGVNRTLAHLLDAIEGYQDVVEVCMSQDLKNKLRRILEERESE